MRLRIAIKKSSELAKQLELKKSNPHVEDTTEKRRRRNHFHRETKEGTSLSREKMQSLLNQKPLPDQDQIQRQRKEHP
jgi:hypothetical protein